MRKFAYIWQAHLSYRLSPPPFSLWEGRMCTEPMTEPQHSVDIPLRRRWVALYPFLARDCPAPGSFLPGLLSCMVSTDSVGLGQEQRSKL